MRVFSQINNCQQKQKKRQKTDKTKRGAPLLGLAKSIYYTVVSKNVISVFEISAINLIVG